VQKGRWGEEALKGEIVIDLQLSCNLQDFEDITAQPSLEEKMETEDPLEDQLEVDRAVLSKSSMQTVMMVHQQLCLNFARSLWYQQSPPSHQAKHYFSTFISCYQTGACLVSQFYPLIGKIASNISVCLFSSILSSHCLHVSYSYILVKHNMLRLGI